MMAGVGIERALEQMVDMMQTFQMRLNGIEVQLAQQRAQATPASGPSQAAAATSTVSGFTGVDTRVLGKPDIFDGTQRTWKDLSTAARAYFTLVYQPLPKAMAMAEASSTPDMSELTLDDAVVQSSTTVYHALLKLCRRPALDQVVHSGGGEGMEAWRQLVMRREPRQGTRYAGQMFEILGWSFAGDVVARRDAFEHDMAYQQRPSDQRWHLDWGRDAQPRRRWL